MIILDTNVVSDLMGGGSPNVLRWLRTVSPEEIYTTVITRSEIRYGVARVPAGRRHDDLERIANAFLIEIADKTLIFDARAADRYGFLVAQRVTNGRPISVPDAQIASIAHVHSATLATRNARDFEGCGLVVINPAEKVPKPHT